MFCVEDACFDIDDRHVFALHDHEDTVIRSFFVCPLRHTITVALVKHNIVFPDLVGYTVISRFCKTVLGYRYEVLFFDGEHFCRYLFCCSVFLSVARPFQPADAAPVEFVDVIKYPVLGIPVFCIFNYRLYTAFGFRIGSVTQKDIKACGIYVILEPFRQDDIAVVLTDCKHLVLVIDDLSWPSPEVSERFDVRLHKVCGRPGPELPQDIFVPGVGQDHPEPIDFLVSTGRRFQAYLAHVNLCLITHRRIVNSFVLPFRFRFGDIELFADIFDVVSEGPLSEWKLFVSCPLLDPVIYLRGSHVRILLQASQYEIFMHICFPSASLCPVLTFRVLVRRHIPVLCDRFEIGVKSPGSL